jgi:hypothetical protein
MSRWLAEGRTLGKSLRRYHAIVVAGTDPEATADAALGIAESQSAERKVFLGDLTGDSGRFSSILSDEDPHGLVDAFDYGITLGRVAKPVAGNPNLQFIPTGATAPDYGELLAHPRWSRLMSAFSEADHLLVLAAPLGAQSIDDLVNQLDGIVLVDGLAPSRVETSKVITNLVLAPLPLPRLSQVLAAPPPPAAPKPKPQPKQPTPPPGQTRPRPVNPTIRPSVVAAAPVRRQTTVVQAFAKPAGYGAGLSILAAFIVFWLMNNPFGDREPRTAVPGPLQQVAGTPTPATAPTPPDPNQANPADSGAAVYAVRMLSANTLPGAILRLQEYGTSMPAATFAPVEKSGRTWYEVLTGAYTTRGGADSLLTSLRAAGRLDSISGVVVRVPYAVLIDSVRPAATISDLLSSLRMRQWPVYALDQRTGWVWIVAGAFETRSQADSYFEELRAAGQPLGVVLRKGRVH